jgi:hypothetical protein
MSEIKSFKLHCEKPYTRHDYKLFFKNGKTMEFDNWEDAQVYWFQWTSTNQLDYFEVLDKKKPKTKSKGF